MSILKPGYSLDRYELLCPLASGGMATVWLARMQGKRGFEKLLAIKTIRSELSDDPRFEEMFLDEARIASGIQHPNVAHIIDLGETDGVLYLVMEWVDGESLARVRKLAAKAGKKIPLGLTLRIIADACAGLHAAHELEDESGRVLGVVHRDVSPQNILIATSGAVKLIDFGIAKAENRAAPPTRTGIVKGKLQYMPPEQARGGKALDRRVDVWALGVCLYELIAEKLPFDGDNQLEILTKVTNTDEPPLIADAPVCVREILSQSIAKDPDERFATASAMRRAIEVAIAKLGLPSTNEDVAAFVDTNLPERAERRKELVAQAMKEAAERASSVDVYTGTVEVVAQASRARPPSYAPARELKTSAASPGGKRATRPSARALLEGKSSVSNSTLKAPSLGGKAGVAARGGGKWVAGLLALLVVGAGIEVWQRDQSLGKHNGVDGSNPLASTSSTDDASVARPTDAAPAPLENASSSPSALPNEAAPVVGDEASPVIVSPSEPTHPASSASRHRLHWPGAGPTTDASPFESIIPSISAPASPTIPPDGEDNPY